MRTNRINNKKAISLKEFNKFPYEQWRYHEKSNLYVSSEGQIARKFKNYYVLKLIHNIRKSKAPHSRIHTHNTTYSVARLVWECFKGEIPEGYYIGHKNGCNTMNEVNNLYLMSRREAVVKGNINKSIQVLDCDTGIVYKNVNELGKKLHVHPDTIRKSINGVTKNSWILPHRYRYIFEDHYE